MFPVIALHSAAVVQKQLWAVHKQMSVAACQGSDSQKQMGGCAGHTGQSLPPLVHSAWTPVLCMCSVFSANSPHPQ